jgi:hypothetical protein
MPSSRKIALIRTFARFKTKWRQLIVFELEEKKRDGRKNFSIKLKDLKNAKHFWQRMNIWSNFSYNIFHWLFHIIHSTLSLFESSHIKIRIIDSLVFYMCYSCFYKYRKFSSGVCCIFFVVPNSIAKKNQSHSCFICM